ncbi:acetoacetate decarboxylase family protein [Planomonospora sp. ID67723]|uniref:acetoacetate decarboxylase family protein n=1 Tax=Planomonospora sp. ID67723 TaxID=2738134 RepID=UPI0018C364DE|nr:acetoacetate decarboxylase family protein [Planomonospora sp. ID67723]MBG0828029.1 acetoacetate decarboxylase family protein [Planomonospora sp. ID67723]
MARHLIQGRDVAMPVRVRDATVCTASYLVRADAARAVIAYSGLDVAEVLPGRAVCSLAFVDYVDGDLDAYHEFGVVFLVRPPEAGPAPRRGLLAGLAELRRSGAGTFVHWLPVDQGFTLEAGRTIWGFPKELAGIDLRLASPYKRCIVRKDGRLVIDLLIRPGMPVPRSAGRLDAYSHLDGATRRIPWSFSPRGVRTRPGGALVRLGNHPVAKELSELGLPKRALVTATIAHTAMSFGEAKQL